MEVKEEPETGGRGGRGEGDTCQLMMIHMNGGAPFGFRIASVSANGFSPFSVSMMRINGKAHRAGLLEADLVLAINGVSCYTSGISHQSVTKLMEYDDPELTLHVLRGKHKCEDSINSALQSLDSQILVLTDQEVQSFIAEKKSKQLFGSSVSNNPHINRLNPTNIGPSRFRLQPMDKTRTKMMERRKDKQATSQRKDQEEENDDSLFLSYESADEFENQNPLISEINSSLKEEQMKNCDLRFSGNGVSKEFQLRDNDICLRTNEINGKYGDGIFNEQYQNSPTLQKPNELHDQTVLADAIKSKPEINNFTQTPSDKAIENRNVGKVDELNLPQVGKGNAINQQQENEKNDKQPRSRYRVEQKLDFSPIQQSRYYDAESGQFRENSSEKPVKRRSNSISSYHMYINPIGMKPSGGLDGMNVDNRSQLPHSVGFNRWHPSENKQLGLSEGACSQASSITQSGSREVAHNNAFSYPGAMYKQVAQSSSPDVRKQQNASYTQINRHSQQSYQPVDNSLPHFSPNQNQPRNTELYRQQTSPSWKSDLHQSSPLRQFSPTNMQTPRIGSSSPSRALPGFSGADFVRPSSPAVTSLRRTPTESIHCPSTPEKNKAVPKLIRLRSNEDETLNTMQHTTLSTANETAKFRPQCRYNDSRSTHNYENVRFSPKISNASPSFCESTRQMSPQKFFPRIDQQRIEKGNSGVNLGSKFNSSIGPQRALIDEITANEGKGGMLFARRRANSDAWIVGERVDAPTKSVEGIIRGERDLSQLQNAATSDVMPGRRRLSLFTGHHPRPNEMNSPNHYRSATPSILYNNFSVSRPTENAATTGTSNVRNVFSQRDIRDQDARTWSPATSYKKTWQANATGLSYTQRDNETPMRLYESEDFTNRHQNTHQHPGYTDL